MIDIVKTLGGLLLLVVGGEMLVRGAVALSQMMRIPPAVVGLTVVAFGTSSPELAVTVHSAFAGAADVAVGSVVGSNIFSVLFILGLSALVAPLIVGRDLIRRDVPLMIFACLAMWAFGSDGVVSRLEGMVLFVILISYLAWLVWKVLQSRVPTQSPSEATETLEPSPSAKSIVVQVLTAVFGIAILSYGSSLLVDGAVSIAQQFGVSELLIGLTIVSGGTSAPELVTSVVAAWRGQRDIAVGNVVGSNLFNILGVIGLSSAVSPVGIAVSPAALAFDIPVMTAVAIACLPVFLTGRSIARWEGAIFFGYYIAYVAYLILSGSGNPLSQTMASVFIYFAMPLTILTILVSLAKHRVQTRQLQSS